MTPPDDFGRQAYIPEFDPSELVAQAKATIARNRAAAEAARKTRELEDPDAA